MLASSPTNLDVARTVCENKKGFIMNEVSLDQGGHDATILHAYSPHPSIKLANKDLFL